MGTKDSTETATSEAVNSEQQSEAVADTVDYKAEAEKWKSLARKHEIDAKRKGDQLNAAMPKLSKLEAMEAAGLSAEERIAQLTTELETERNSAAQLRAESLRSKIVATAGLQPSDAAFIQFGTEEEMTEAAKALAKRLKPSVDLEGGARTTATAPKTFGEVIAAQMKAKGR